ncbi:Fur-regulated basic protein FbpA [Siminovitchia fortis]|uniref:Fur-regulated basic protein FbpA n=1 Tax=Siminovitchia fortis TaxID=254758 RepID=A0A451GCA4_9BACI|nr:Fur-regulated basic protein FbpA [Siminovitchia fortis]RWR12867.1 Fur-regulated basic protein FbpA [Siminovitchia fortis]WHY80475.1 Fur-regulated basic protein FbpA [Siminovitchia fortis]
MSQLTQTVENRRKELIDKLVIMGVYKHGEKHLFELSLRELEYKYRRVKSNCHPHSQTGSIRWVGKKINV